MTVKPSRYIVIVTPFASHIRELFPEAIEPEQIADFWKGKLFVVPVPTAAIPLSTLQRAVSVPPEDTGYIEPFHYHINQNYTTYCNEEFLFRQDMTGDPKNWLIRTKSYGIAGSIAIVQGLTNKGDTPSLTENRLATLLATFQDPCLSALWPDSQAWRQCLRDMS